MSPLLETSHDMIKLHALRVQFMGGRMWLMAERAERLPRMIRGSVVLQRRRCGKPNCRCTDGLSLHEATVLSYSEAGRNRTVMLSSEQIAPVRAAVERYRAAQAKLEVQGNAGLAALLSRQAELRRVR